MKNSEQPAFVQQEKLDGLYQKGREYTGLTKREYFAAMAISAGASAKEALSRADETLKLLENEQSK